MQRLIRAFFLSLVISLCSSLYAKITLVTIAFNRPEFIELQYKSLCTFLEDDWEQIIFINATNPKTKKQLIQECKKYNIQYVLVPVDQDERLSVHGQATNFAFAQLLSERVEKVVLFENDCFLLRPFSIERDFAGYDLAYISRYYFYKEATPAIENTKFDHENFYINPMFCFLDLSKLPDPHQIKWRFYYIDWYFLDTGGEMYPYLRNHPNIVKREIKEHTQFENFLDFFRLTEKQYAQLQSEAPPAMLPALTPLLTFCKNRDAIHFFHDFAVVHYSDGSRIWRFLPQNLRAKKWQLVQQLVNAQIEAYTAETT